jgi:hypothetical protein
MIDHADGCQVAYTICDCKPPATPDAAVQRAAHAIAATLQAAANADKSGTQYVDLGDLQDAQIDGYVNLLDLARAAIEAAALPPVNDYQNYITLHGGPAALDGKGYQISDAVVRHGTAYVLAPVPPRYDEDPPIINPHRVAIYERRIKAAGAAATCEARVWMEWHFTGYRKD